MRRPGVLTLFLILASQYLSAGPAAANGIIIARSVQAKNYYLLSLIQQNTSLRKMLEKDPLLVRIAKERNTNVTNSLADCDQVTDITNVLKFSDGQIQMIGERLAALYTSSNKLGVLVQKQLIPSGYYALLNKLPPKEQLVKAWEQDARGINRCIEVYGEGVYPSYADIDSNSFNTRDPKYVNVVKQAVKATVTETTNSGSFFLQPMNAALAFLALNERRNAADYEPMEKTVNKAAWQKKQTLNWGRYKYTVLLIPGAGPAKGEAISNGAMGRCKLAADVYRQGVAPFVMVSGGRVHPFKTKYCEAEEMKKYLITQLHIPSDAIFMEPYARHTTTNLRNASRLMIRYGFPINKPGLIITDAVQSAAISYMGFRCKQELGYTPYRLGRRLSTTKLEFSPVFDALQINPMEPLDP